MFLISQNCALERQRAEVRLQATTARLLIWTYSAQKGTPSVTFKDLGSDLHV